MKTDLYVAYYAFVRSIHYHEVSQTLYKSQVSPVEHLDS